MVTLYTDGRISQLLRFSTGDGSYYSTVHDKWKFHPVTLPSNLSIVLSGTVLGIICLPITWVSYPFPARDPAIRFAKSLLCWVVLAVSAFLIWLISRGPIFLIPPGLGIALIIATIGPEILDWLKGLRNAANVKPDFLIHEVIGDDWLSVNWVDREAAEELKALEASHEEYEEFIKLIAED